MSYLLLVGVCVGVICYLVQMGSDTRLQPTRVLFDLLDRHFLIRHRHE